MNNSLNVQSPSFGMAYKKGEVKQIAKYLNKQEPKALEELSKKMSDAVQKLKDTKYADATLYADEKGEELYHYIEWRYPYFTEDGAVALGSGSSNVNGIDEAVAETLKKEQEMTAAFEYAKKQAEILKAIQSACNGK